MSKSTDSTKLAAGQGKRKQRLARALRANLTRRKAARRARKASR